MATANLRQNVQSGWNSVLGRKDTAHDLLHARTGNGVTAVRHSAGDEVIMPSYTFVSTANAFVLRGAKIKFVDIDPRTMNINADLIEEAITERTRVIVPVHYAGVGCDMDKIMAIARKHHLIVVEDAAQGVMAKYKENISEQSEISVPTASTRQRTIRWERAVRSISTGQNM